MNTSSTSSDFIRFKEPQNISDIRRFLDELEIKYSIDSNIKSNLKFIGFSDGRDNIPNTVSFVEDILDFKLLGTSLYISDYTTKNKNSIKVDDPRYVFIKLLEIYGNKCLTIPYEENKQEDPSNLYSNNQIHKTAIIECGVNIGSNNVISAGVILKKGTIIGNNCTVRENTVVGGDGIALYVSNENGVLKYPHLGGVRIKDNVEIGSNVSIMKGILNMTFIDSDTVIGNLSNIGHGCKINKKVWMSVGCLIGGHTEIKRFSTLGLGVSIKNGLVLEENSSIGMGAVVTKNTAPHSSYFGNPARQLKGLKTGPKR